jgi:RNA binding exosome subunit
MQMQFSSVAISFFIQSTEDTERLVNEVAQALKLELNELSKEELEGHNGNQLFLVKAHLTSKRANEVVETIAKGLSALARRQLRDILENSMDEHDALFLRFDRQSITQRLYLGEEEPIRVKIKPRFRQGGRQAMIDSYTEALKLR